MSGASAAGKPGNHSVQRLKDELLMRFGALGEPELRVLFGEGGNRDRLSAVQCRALHLILDRAIVGDYDATKVCLRSERPGG